MPFEKYSISNFKCFNEKTSIALRPITINIGPNNSGKSSFLQSLALIKHSLENSHRIKNKSRFIKILEELHSFSLPNFGEPSAFLNSTEKEHSIGINIANGNVPEIFHKPMITMQLFYKFKDRLTGYGYVNENSDIKENVDVNSTSKPSKKRIFGTISEPKGRGILSRYVIEFDNVPVIEINRSEDFFDVGQNGFLQAYSGNIRLLNALEDHLPSAPKSYLPKSINLLFIEDSFINPEKLYPFLKTELNKVEIPVADLISELIYRCLNEFIYTEEYINDFQIIKLDRRENKRFIDQESNSLFKGCIDYYYGYGGGQISKIHETFSKILSLFNLPTNFIIEYHNDFGFQFKLRVEKGVFRNISDFGSGINQLIPMLFASSKKIQGDAHWIGSNNEMVYEQSGIIIEEPESNLHPNFQSKLADMFTILKKERNLNFIIETHSEYMVRRFQNLVANGNLKLKSKDIIINYFWIDKETGKHKCKQIEILPNGQLSESFEDGFYDESVNLKFELLRLIKAQSN